MNLYGLFNANFGSCLIILLIALDYLRKYNTDNFLRKLLIILLGSVFFAAVLDFTGYTMENRQEDIITALVYANWSLYFIARNCVFYYSIAFIDYFSHGSAKRTKKIFRVISIIMILYAISVIPNFRFGYYFYVSRNNVYMPGFLHLLQLLISYFPAIVILINISLAQKDVKRTQIFLTVFFIIITAIGAAIDVILLTTNFIWPCVTAAVLYVYFFIIRSDSGIDSLTGIGNRYSFYEYVSRLNRESNKKNYAFVKFNLNRFRKINDTLGYLEGDNALRNIASIIKNCIRNNDFAARFGGDEFILVTAEENDIQRIIDRINNALDNENKKNKRPYQLNMSYIHDVYTTNSGSRIQDFLSQMDSKLYKVKDKLAENGEKNV